jgi:hypothetical protein
VEDVGVMMEVRSSSTGAETGDRYDLVVANRRWFRMSIVAHGSDLRVHPFDRRRRTQET